MYVLDAGRLKKRISIYGYQEVTDDLGQKSTRIVKKASVWAEIKPVRVQISCQTKNSDRHIFMWIQAFYRLPGVILRVISRRI